MSLGTYITSWVNVGKKRMEKSAVMCQEGLGLEKMLGKEMETWQKWCRGERARGKAGKGMSRKVCAQQGTCSCRACNVAHFDHYKQN